MVIISGLTIGREGMRMRVETIDLNFLGTEKVIASFLLLGGGSAAIVETGPTTCLGHLEAGLEANGVSPGDVREVFLTHIHLDHAGASGHLAQSLPNATFYVHELGYPHLADPSKLVKSAARIYGDRMDELWGDARPVPEERLVILGDGDEVEAAGGRLVAHDTPGHAYHHLAYLEPDSGSLFAGDVAGIRLPGQSYVRPPTPPPEIDVEAWVRSIEKIRKIAPSTLLPTHFGRYDDVDRHLSELEQRLQDWLLFVEGRTNEGASREEISEELRVKGDEEMLAEGAAPEESGRYDLAGNYEMLTAGILRYVERRRRES
jgi:glyoxylase-like metal-dependent hydrolase (beta-lactamase superfamily II)